MFIFIRFCANFSHIDLINLKTLEGPKVLQYEQLHKDCLENNGYFVPPISIDEMVKVLIDSKRDTGHFWSPVRKINSTFYKCGTIGGSHLFDSAYNLGLELKHSQWEDSYLPVGFGMALKMVLESHRFIFTYGVRKQSSLKFGCVGWQSENGTRLRFSFFSGF